MGQDDLSVFTPQEVTKHNTLQDLWVILDGTVYNVTDFVSKVFFSTICPIVEC